MAEEQTQSVRSVEEIEAWIIEQVADYTGLSTEEISPTEPFTKYGLDSMFGITFVGDLEEYLNIQLPATLLWDYTTIQAVAQFLAGELDKR